MAADLGPELVPNYDFARGLAQWEGADLDRVSVEQVEEGPAAQAARFDASGSATEVGMVSDFISVKPGSPYQLSGWVNGEVGSGTWKLAVDWLDADRGHIAYANSWTGILVGKGWVRQYVRLVAPAQAVYARLLIGAHAGTTILITEPSLRELSGESEVPNLAIEVLPEQPSPVPFGYSHVTVRLENRGTKALAALSATLALPAGMKSDQPLAWTLTELAPQQADKRTITLWGQPASGEAPFTCRVTAQVDGQELVFEEAALPFVTRGKLVETPTAALTPPVAPPSSVKLGCYYFPVMLDWRRSDWGVSFVDYLEPVLGYYDETLPEVADWHIKWAVEHGIRWFAFDWYWNQGMTYINEALEKGFLQSRFIGQMEFCINWCNEGQCTDYKPLDFSTKALEDVTRYWCSEYFTSPSYLRVDGKPVVLLYHAWTIAAAHGGWEGCALALEAMREVARQAGHTGIYFVGVQNNPLLTEFGKGGFDAVTAYAYGFADVAWDAGTRSLPYIDLLPRHREAFAQAQQRAHEQGLDYIPSGWCGWDDIARSGKNAVRTRGNTPEAIRRMMQPLPEFVEPDTRLALFEAWNEWGEGGEAEPGKPWGFGYLDAIRDTLTEARGPYEVPVPDRTSWQALQTAITYEELNDYYFRGWVTKLGLLKAGLQVDFSDPDTLWFRPASGLTNMRIVEGALRVEAISGDPVLFGPPIMDLDASLYSAIEFSLSVEAGKQGQLFWTTDEARDYSEARSVHFDLIADGQRHDYVIQLEGQPEWKGLIRHFRFDPTDAPGQVALYTFTTVPAAP